MCVVYVCPATSLLMCMCCWLIAAGKLLSKYEGQLPTRLWIAPPTRMDETQLISEGYYSTYGKVCAHYDDDDDDDEGHHIATPRQL